MTPLLTSSIQDLSPPAAPPDVDYLLPSDQTDLGSAIWHVISSAFESISPDITQAISVCFALLIAMLLISLLQGLHEKIKQCANFVATIVISTIIFSGANALIREGAETVGRLSDYGKLLVPVMTTALAAQGGITSGASIYTATALFDSLLTTLIKTILIPMVYLFLGLSIAKSAIGEELLKKIRDFMKWLIGWSMKLILYIFTGYISITGIITGVTDATAMKATKLTISGMVPVVGGILSEASEAVLVGAGAVKNTIGIGGLLTLLAIIIGPFLRIGTHYLLLKLTAALSAIFCDQSNAELIQDFSSAMGFLLAMTGTICVIFFISIVCMMWGMNL